MAMKYLVTHNMVGDHLQGAEVTVEELGGEDTIARLLALGAIEEVGDAAQARPAPAASGDGPPPANLTTGQPGGAVGTEDEGARTAGTVGVESAQALAAAGYGTFAAIRAASDDDLRKVPGIGDARIKQLRDLTA